MSTGEGRQQRDSSPIRRSSLHFGQRIYSPHSIAAIASELSAQGVPAAVALAGTGLRMPQLEMHTTQVSYRQIDIAIRNGLRLSNDPAIALHAGQRMHLTAYGMYGYALMSSATYADVRDFSNQYIGVVGPLCAATYSYESATVVCALEPLHWLNPAEDAYRFATEFALAAHLTAMRDLVGASFGFSRISLDYVEPPHASVYNDVFQCPVLFGQGGIEYWYEISKADGPVALADPRTHGMAREMCDHLLTEVNRAGGVAADVRRLLIGQAGRYPSLEAIAEKLGMPSRVLRRRLEAEETSYRDLLAEVRARLAIEYLRKTQMTNEDIASRLGYSDAANFRHAFLRWTGRSPSDFRKAARVGR